MENFPQIAFTIFLATYVAMRAYWQRRAELKPVQENKASFLDKLNVVLVALSTIILPLISLYTSWLGPFDYPTNNFLVLFSLPFLTVGLVIFWISHRDLGENWSPTLELKNHHDLITHGVFRHIRHPMYLSIWLCSIGQALCVPNYVGGLGGLVAWSFLYFLRIDREEQMMLEKFGESYRTYCLQTKRLIPRIL